MTSWMAKYDAITKDEEPRRPGQRLPTSMLGNELMNKEQLYDLFQQVLNVKKFEHQLLYNAMQVGVTGHCLFVVQNKNILYLMRCESCHYKFHINYLIQFAVFPASQGKM